MAPSQRQKSFRFYERITLQIIVKLNKRKKSLTYQQIKISAEIKILRILFSCILIRSSFTLSFIFNFNFRYLISRTNVVMYK